MSKTYTKKLNELLKDDYTIMSKLCLLYELESFFDVEEIDDELIDLIYQAYIDHINYNCIYDYVRAINYWCEINETEFSGIEDYKKMLSEIY